jgi:hypothetical protein
MNDLTHYWILDKEVDDSSHVDKDHKWNYYSTHAKKED